MKRWSILALLLLTVLIAVPVSAQAQNTAANQDVVKKRIEERKTRLKTKLAAAESQRITARCAAAQQKLANVTGINQETLTKYQAFIDRVEQLEQTLAANDTKSTELLGEVAMLKTKYQALVKAATDFNLSVSDAKTLDCKQDPTAFKAALEDARAQAKILKDARVDLLTYVNTALKPTLQALKDKKN